MGLRMRPPRVSGCTPYSEFSPTVAEHSGIAVITVEAQRPLAAKRILSPDSVVETEPKRRMARDLSVACLAGSSLAPPRVHTPATEYGSPFSSEEEGSMVADADLESANTRQLLARAGSAC